jgi:pilus assembly protein CpaB
MSRRARAAGFAVAAALCAALAASAAGGYRASIDEQLGELRPAVVANRSLARGRPIRPQALPRFLEVRRVPARFLPPGVLADPAEAAGREPAAEIPAGSYVVAAQLRAPRADDGSRPRPDLEQGDRPVEITVSAAAALAEIAPPPSAVDVVVTTEPGAGGGAGRTYVAAEAIRLLDLRAAAEDAGDVVPGPGAGEWVATLALTRAQALRLIQAESFARSVRLIPR